MYLPTLRGEVSQGDIFDSLPTVYVQRVGLQPKLGYARSILLTHDCEYDKPRTETVLIAEVWPLAEVNKGSQGYIRQNRVLGAFYLEAYRNVLAESYVDLRNVSRIEKTITETSNQAGSRLLSLTDEVRMALQRQIALFFGVDR